MYGLLFDWIYFLSPGAIQELELGHDNYFNMFSLDWIFGKIDYHYRDLFTPDKTFKLQERINILFLIDDFVGSIRETINKD